MLRLDKATYLSLACKFLLSERQSNSLWGLHVFTIFRIPKYSIHFV